eukprot:c29066_g1_i1 orf=845-3769(-)
MATPSEKKFATNPSKMTERRPPERSRYSCNDFESSNRNSAIGFNRKDKSAVSVSESQNAVRPCEETYISRGCPPGFSKNIKDQSDVSPSNNTADIRPGQSPGSSSNGRFTRFLQNKDRKESSVSAQLEGAFVPYLPQDDAMAAGLVGHEGGVDAVETQRVADLLNEELSKLLRMNPREFWRAVTTDRSIQTFLDSYLQFRRRWFDLPVMKGGGTMAGVIVGDHDLSRRVFMVLYRLSSSREPRYSATDCLSTKDHSVAIREKNLLDIPKLLDICALYGQSNPELTHCLVNNAFRSQIQYNEDLADIVPTLLNTINTMHQRCYSTSLEIPTMSNLNPEKLQREILEVFAYLNDVLFTLDSFVEAYPYGAVILDTVGHYSDYKGQLLFTMADVHDNMLPLLQKLFSQFGMMESYDILQQKNLRLRLLNFSWHLLSICYLGEGCEQPWNKDSDQTGWVGKDPEARGSAIVQAMLGMTGANGKGGSQPSEHSEGRPINAGSLLRNLERRYKIMEIIENLQQNGSVVLDAAQYECICALLFENVPKPSMSQPSVGKITQEQETVIILQSKISHIKDILPDYGNGFLAACLEAYNDNPEEVIRRILEGTLHPDLVSLDKTLEIKPDREVSAASNRDKGKAILNEKPTVSLRVRAFSDNDKWKEDLGKAPFPSTVKEEVEVLAQRVASSFSASSSTMGESWGGRSLSTSTQESDRVALGRYVRKEKGDKNGAQLLYQIDEVNALRVAALAIQYDDEYDDSFDDLGTNITEGAVDEAENLVGRIALQSRKAGAASGNRSVGLLGRPLNKSREDGMWRDDATNTSRMKLGSQESLPNREDGGMVSRASNSLGASSRGRGRRKEPKMRYYVKDGKNYSYKIAGAVAVSSVEESDALKKKEEENIYGLGQGGNIPLKATEVRNAGNMPVDQGGRKFKATRGASPGDAGGKGKTHVHGDGDPRKGYDKHHRKDQAMRKHFASIGGI